MDAPFLLPQAQGLFVIKRAARRMLLMFRLKSCRAADSDVNEYASTQTSRRRQSGRFRLEIEQKAEGHRKNSETVQQKAETFSLMAPTAGRFVAALSAHQSFFSLSRW